jgi:hypothetical protein
MNQSYRDIITVIQRHGPITTSEVCEHLEPLGYGGGMKWQDFRDTIAKQLGYLKSKGELTGEDKPQAKGKPLRYWSLAESQNEEMASDVAEMDLLDAHPSSWPVDYLLAKATYKENLTVETPETFTDTWTNPPAVEFKAGTFTKPTPISVNDALAGFPHWMDKDDSIHAFLRGIEFAEKHHGINQ